MVASTLSLDDVLAAYVREQYALTPGTASYYRTMLNGLSGWRGGAVSLATLSADLLRSYFATMLRSGYSARTVNDRRQVLLMLWKFAADRGWIGPAPQIPKAREPRRIPTAYSIEEIGRLIAACRNAPAIRTPSATWLPDHWIATVLVIYDTSNRIGSLLRVPRSCFDARRQTLTIPAELQKGRAETFQRLHSQTCEILERLPRASRLSRSPELLLPWPFGRRQIWIRFGKILDAAGLPSSRRDKFHRIRRTSYTQVAVSLGIQAATRHAAHQTDLSRFYLDPRFLNHPEPLDSLPRP